MSRVLPGNGSTLPGAVGAGDAGACDLVGATVGASVGAGRGGASTGDRVVAGVPLAGAVSGMSGAALGESSVGAIRGAAPGVSAPDRRTTDSASHSARPVATAAQPRTRGAGRRASVRGRMDHNE